MELTHPALRLKKLGINTYKEAVIYMHAECAICRSEGFEFQTRVQVTLNGRSILATINIVESDLLAVDEAALSTAAWNFLGAQEGDPIYLTHPKPRTSFAYLHSKIYGHEFTEEQLIEIIRDVVDGSLSDVQMASFLTACAGGHLTQTETLYLTRAMLKVSDVLAWPQTLVVDKHCVGGLPGNRTTLIVVPIVAAFGLTMPNTSSRAITSPAGTADVMEVIAPVTIDLPLMQRIVEQEKGCMVWGGAAELSPADDVLIRIERVLDLDGEGQMVASILSKKVAAGVTHLLVDIPVGPTAKVRTQETASVLKEYLEHIGKSFNMVVQVVITNGEQPVGRGIGPTLEMQDIIAVLKNEKNAPADLRERSLMLAGHVLEFSPDVKLGSGKKLATELLDSGRAWEKFQAIAQAQGGLFPIPKAAYTEEVRSKKSGRVLSINNHRLSRVVKLLGAPASKAAGVEWLVHVGQDVRVGDVLCVMHAETPGELKYALNYLEQGSEIICFG